MCPIPALAIHEPERILPNGGEAETGAGLRRPRLLMSAARHGLGEYRRARDLLRLLGYCPNAALAVEDLTRMEAEAEAARRAGSPAWSCTRHVEVLIALLAERALAGG
jgi:hypothetical protein